ncbi:S24 family peptidase [Pseudomaricurvus alkylphenolicus]|uniref:LexA family protein n=1 Tax=Pseudomaricurvus alkylphenolicus TaxID=1306991 RepID=UPI00141E16FB|nr:S24 family peptidase [Pseudomaricurvus alkylphenolicus]NIB44838.1 S24 family peptidase [Pseudomaricurvus alkylphenolicus]
MAQSELARRIDVKPQAIQYLCSPKAQGSSHNARISNVLQINPQWLETGEGSMHFSDNSNPDAPDSPSRPAIIPVPVFSWDQADKVNESKPSAETWVDPEYATYESFGLKMRGDSMADSTLLTIPNGAIIVVDPRESAIENAVTSPDADEGTRVVVKLGEDVVCRTIKREAGKLYLTPRKQTYDSITFDPQKHRILGVVTIAVLSTISRNIK